MAVEPVDCLVRLVEVAFNGDARLVKKCASCGGALTTTSQDSLHEALTQPPAPSAGRCRDENLTAYSY